MQNDDLVELQKYAPSIYAHQFSLKGSPPRSCIEVLAAYAQAEDRLPHKHEANNKLLKWDSVSYANFFIAHIIQQSYKMYAFLEDHLQFDVTAKNRRRLCG